LNRTLSPPRLRGKKSEFTAETQGSQTTDSKAFDSDRCQQRQLVRGDVLPAARMPDPAESARAARLRYVSDDSPGIRRVRSGKGFVYINQDDKTVRDPDELRRLKSLAIPPAWRDVWICPLPHGHLQATGRDAKGRKQHRYHPRWREVRDETKYDRMREFAKMLPAIRRKVKQDLALPGLPREKVLATVIRLLETSMIRVGNEEYRRQNNSFGLATLRSRHVNVWGASIRFEFRGKSGVHHAVDLNDRRLARIIKQCQDLPGYELFQYIGDDAERYAIDSGDVNDYLRQIAGGEFSSKDFRTWAGTVLAAQALGEFHGVDSKTRVKNNILQAIESVAKKLGNTKAVCRKCYIHPAVIDAYTDGSLLQALRRHAKKPAANHSHALAPEEAAVLALLNRKLKLANRRDNGSNLHSQLKRSLRGAKSA
jgi:DNA topoisomerase I